MEKIISGVAVVISIAAILVGLNAQGVIGPVGPQGPQGPKGEQGVAGRNGIDGVNGKNGSTNLGAVTGPDNYVTTYFHAGAIIGGSCIASSTSGSVATILANELGSAECLDYTLNVQDATLTLMASTSSWYPNKVGGKRQLIIRNASTTATMDITFAAGSGVLLKKATSSLVLFGDTDGANYGLFTFTRKANGDVEGLYQPFTD